MQLPDMGKQEPVMVRVSQSQYAFGVHKSTLYRWANNKHIVIHRRGAMSFVDPIEVKNFIMGLGDQVGDYSPKEGF
jgi:hypothetical protein